MPAKKQGQMKQKGSARGTRAKQGGQTVGDVMTTDPVALIGTSTLVEAAQQMRDHDIGDVIVLDDTSARLQGLVTDRDIVIRAIAEEREPGKSTLASICSDDPVTVSPADDIETAISLMREHAIRRLPVVEDERPVGVVSIGDLALERDRDSALADISAAPPDE